MIIKKLPQVVFVNNLTIRVLIISTKYKDIVTADSTDLCCSTEIIMLDLLHWNFIFIITIYKRRLNYNIRLASAYDEITFYFLSDKKDIQKETFPLQAITVDDNQPMRLYYNSVAKEFWLEVPLRFIHKGEISKTVINLLSLKCYD